MARLFLFTIGVWCVVASPADAQAAAGDVSGGYRFMNVSPATYGRGWNADASYYLGTRLAIVGDVGGSYKRDEHADVIGGVSFAGTTRINLHTYLGGVRVRLGQNAAVTPFAQALAGGAHVHGSAVVHALSGAVPDVTSAGGENNWAMALDGGVIVRPWRALGVRVSAGYLRLFRDTTDHNAFRLNTAIVVPF